MWISILTWIVLHLENRSQLLLRHDVQRHNTTISDTNLPKPAGDPQQQTF
jgi:hypothetical protein